MARLVKGHRTAWLQPEGKEEPETNPTVSQHEVQSDTTEGKVIADYNSDVNYEGSEPEDEPVAQEEKEGNSDAEYANMEISYAGTFCQRMMPLNNMWMIQQINQE